MSTTIPLFEISRELSDIARFCMRSTLFPPGEIAACPVIITRFRISADVVNSTAPPVRA